MTPEHVISLLSLLFSLLAVPFFLVNVLRRSTRAGDEAMYEVVEDDDHDMEDALMPTVSPLRARLAGYGLVAMLACLFLTVALTVFKSIQADAPSAPRRATAVGSPF